MGSRSSGLSVVDAKWRETVLNFVATSSIRLLIRERENREKEEEAMRQIIDKLDLREKEKLGIR